MSADWDGDWYEDAPIHLPEPPAGGSARDYPYDPRAVVEQLDGLDKLRAVQDRVRAQLLYELYWTVERNERDPRMRQQRERELKRQEHARRQNLARACFAGRYGAPGKSLAQHLLLDEAGNQRTDFRSLQEFERAFAELKAERMRASKQARRDQAAGPD